MKRFLFLNTHHSFFEKHGISCLSAVLKTIPGTEVFYLNTAFLKGDDLCAKIKKINPDVFLYSSLSCELESYIRLDKFLKKNFSLPSIIGGPGVTSSWSDLLNESFDYLCVGEGEVALKNFVQNGETDKNLFQRSQGRPLGYHEFVDLNELPFPDRELLYTEEPLLKEIGIKSFFASRGCPYDCSYCFNHSFKEQLKECGPYIRHKSVETLLNEIDSVQKSSLLRFIVFRDDTFLTNRVWFEEFLQKYPKRFPGLKFSCNLRPNLVTEHVVSSLKAVGCERVLMGIESGDSSMRQILKREMSDEQIIKAYHLLRKHGLKAEGFNILGLPGETREQIYKTIDLNIKAQTSISIASIYVPLKGTALFEYAREEGYLAEEDLSYRDRQSPRQVFLKNPQLSHESIKRLWCLFPFFVAFPISFRLSWLREGLLKLPIRCLLPIYFFTNGSRNFFFHEIYKYYSPRIIGLTFWHYLQKSGTID